jgi:multiple sugar transport system substrate-binding protein
MIRMLKKMLLQTIATILLLAMVLSGCGGDSGNKTADNNTVPGTSSAPSGNAKPADPQVSKDPVTLQVWINATLSDLEFAQLWQEPVKKKYPNITLAMVRQDKDHTLPAMIAAHEVPDLLYTNTNTITQRILDPGLASDLVPYIKKFNFDLNRLDPTMAESIKSYGSKGEIYGIPFTLVNSALWYNKDIFDKFGIGYPKDGMTWEDTYQLATKLSREVDGKTYYGLQPFDVIWHLASQLSIPVTDKNDKAVISDKWGDVFKYAMKVFDIPGNKPKTFNGGINRFTGDQDTAMFTFWVGNMIAKFSEMESKGLTMNWDVAQLPSFPESKNMNMQTEFHQFFLTSTGKYKDQAFQVMQVITSDEVQTLASKMGRVTVLKNPDINKVYASDLPWVKGKNLQSIFKSKPAKLVSNNDRYSRWVLDELNKSFNQVYTGKVSDINTALREAGENANKRIAEDQAARK